MAALSVWVPLAAVLLGACSDDPPPAAPVLLPSRVAASEPAALAVPIRESDGHLRLLTYNVLADPTPFQRVRIPALMGILEGSAADVIALQEVAPWFLEMLRKEPWVRKYHFSQSAERLDAPGGGLILSRFPIVESGYEPLTSRQMRGVLWSTLDVSGERMIVATVHLESPLEAGPVRAVQLQRVFEILKQSPRALLMGDFNFGDGAQPETATVPSDYEDLWRTGDKDGPGYTWNMEKSRMARVGSFPNEKSRRLDRMLLRWPGTKVHTMAIVGSEPTEVPEVFPSDHFGLVADVLLPSQTHGPD